MEQPKDRNRKPLFLGLIAVLIIAAVGVYLFAGNSASDTNDVAADASSDAEAAIAAAGILAKVSRDRWISEIVLEHPDWDTKYGLSTNMGYGTATHMTGLSLHGVTDQHRRSYGPVRASLGLPLKEKKGKGWKGT